MRLFLFIYRVLIHFSIFLFISLPLQLLGAIVLIPVVPFYDIGKLPFLFRWFDSVDTYTNRDLWTINLINGGGWIDDPITPSGTYSGHQLLINKYVWLAWRNPINYFSYKVLGIQVQGEVITTLNNLYPLIPVPLNESIEIGDTEGNYPGIQSVEMAINNKTYYEYYMACPYTIFGATRCIRIRIGYKLTDFVLVNGALIEEVFVISPFHSYSGKL